MIDPFSSGTLRSPAPVSQPAPAATAAAVSARAQDRPAAPGWMAASALARLMAAALPAAGVLVLAAWALAGI